jgi:hypothetical protein
MAAVFVGETACRSFHLKASPYKEAANRPANKSAVTRGSAERDAAGGRLRFGTEDLGKMVFMGFDRLNVRSPP